MIICFGDSLTVGYQSPTHANPMGEATPYGHFLSEGLEGRVEVRVSGICGELTDEMVNRFSRDVLPHRPSHVVILGGTNDLGWNARPVDIMGNLVNMYESARAARIVPVPVTVPSIRVDSESGGPDAETWLNRHLSGRKELNSMIEKYAGDHELTTIDLFSATVDPATRLLAPEYSNDGLHLTTAGYRLLARLLYDQVFSNVFPPVHGMNR